MPAAATRPGRDKFSGVTDSTDQSPHMRKASETGTARTKRHCSGVSSLQRSAQNRAQFAKCQLSDMCVSYAVHCTQVLLIHFLKVIRRKESASPLDTQPASLNTHAPDDAP
ncbi:hypothetical protein XPR_1712 [Xanthomonas arboricola pv. pruni MAFF 301420]|uniref:Uncharacterized protein n=2 Tax=Xanthomonas arboricola pv. pruni TaxID=69929 RepID=W4SFC6_9XANT|nr:alkaline phosphatase [Xanthomonas arboricola pv. pruni str. MAFF 311562]GAE55077.1 hypothetical protein XPR_1712 [Xanthomonas arboricola pv. pruni MAFF 301420]GAE60277.1 hypothetical protein XPN_2183 [Xanthomonas arboricola pv. pruni MAFF 301427]